MTHRSDPPPEHGPSRTAATDHSGRYAYDGLERVIHEKARLGIMTSLVAHPRGLLFSDLKEMCKLTDGNLSRHLQVLHDERLVEIWKGQHQGRPQTLVRLTETGRTRFADYLATLEQVVADALQAVPGANKSHTNALRGPGLSPA